METSHGGVSDGDWMDETVSTNEVPPDVSPMPVALELALWVPAFFVVLWFMFRLFGGRWITEPDPLSQAPYDPPDASTHDPRHPDPPGGA